MIRVLADAEALAAAAADLFVQQCADAVAAHGRGTVVLAGGSTPRRAYELLSAPPRCTRVDWRRLHVFWGDERCVPADDPRSNAGAARRALLDHVPVPADQIHPLVGSAEPAAAACAYEHLLRAQPRLDLVLLGLGTDGHTASLFPGSEALGEDARWVLPVPAPAANDVARITLTAPALNRATLAVFLVSGTAKAGALRQVHRGPRDPDRWPAQLIAPTAGETVWLVDRNAAAGL